LKTGLALAWLAFLATFYLSHRQVRAGRAREKPERRLGRERSSDAGMALQFGAVLLALFLPGPWRPTLAGPALALAAASILWLRAALQHLGRQWRVQAVIAADHELITTGPYRLLRHPVYLAFLGMIVATVLVRGHVLAGVLAILVFSGGTEIRVRAEERLLLNAFQSRFSEYRARTRWAYLPFIR
jgi:protein-S-isoprenylcysteine O-methyltransferase Ste14